MAKVKYFSTSQQSLASAVSQSRIKGLQMKLCNFYHQITSNSGCRNTENLCVTRQKEKNNTLNPRLKVLKSNIIFHKDSAAKMFDLRVLSCLVFASARHSVRHNGGWKLQLTPNSSSKGRHKGPIKVIKHWRLRGKWWEI